MKPKVFRFSISIDGGIKYVLQSCPYRQVEYKDGKSSGVLGLGSYKCERCPYCVERNKEKQTVKCSFRVLDLSLTYHWYDEIESGRKVIEYRALNDYWRKRLMNCCDSCQRLQKSHEFIEYNPLCEYCRLFKPVHYDAVRFHRGQGGKQTMMYECARISIEYGHVVYGATPDVPMFHIYLGKRLQ